MTAATKTRYDAVAMSLHWLIAALLIFMLFFGEELIEAEDGGGAFGPSLHVSIGSAILVAQHIPPRLAPVQSAARLSRRHGVLGADGSKGNARAFLRIADRHSADRLARYAEVPQRRGSGGGPHALRRIPAAGCAKPWPSHEGPSRDWARMSALCCWRCMCLPPSSITSSTATTCCAACCPSGGPASFRAIFWVAARGSCGAAAGSARKGYRRVPRAPWGNREKAAALPRARHRRNALAGGNSLRQSSSWPSQFMAKAGCAVASRAMMASILMGRV